MYCTSCHKISASEVSPKFAQSALLVGCALCTVSAQPPIAKHLVSGVVVGTSTTHTHLHYIRSGGNILTSFLFSSSPPPSPSSNQHTLSRKKTLPPPPPPPPPPPRSFLGHLQDFPTDSSLERKRERKTHPFFSPFLPLAGNRNKNRDSVQSPPKKIGRGEGGQSTKSAKASYALK